MDHPNAMRIRELFAAFERADLAMIQDVIPENATWRFPGRKGQLAGVHVGRDAILSFLLSVGSLTDETFELELIDVVANDRWAVVLFTGSAQRNGKVLDNPTCLRMRLEDGKVVDVWEFVWDLYEVDEFWE